ncbi:endonuclease domain-containing protein [Deinococcus caeni]
MTPHDARTSPSTDVARMLRRRMTPEEILLWQHLRRRQLGVTFRRQEPMGRYVADFVCYERTLVIELDGSQHLNSDADRERDADMLDHGFQTLRFWNKKCAPTSPASSNESSRFWMPERIFSPSP